MPRVTFTADFDFTPAANKKVTVAYKAGVTEIVTRECAEKAKAKGRARDALPGEVALGVGAAHE